MVVPMKITEVEAAIFERDGKLLLAQRVASSDQVGRCQFPYEKPEIAVTRHRCWRGNRI